MSSNGLRLNLRFKYHSATWQERASTRRLRELTLSDEEVRHSEAVDAELTRFADRRSRQSERESENEKARIWRESELRYLAGREAALRSEWHKHFVRQARIHEELAQRAREKAARLAVLDAGEGVR
jgi:hypothetical protein